MAITRTQKESRVETLAQELRNAKMTVLVSYGGLSVKHAEALRTEAKDNNGNFRIVKNALLRLASEQVFPELDLSHLQGPVAVVVGYDDQVMPAKTAAHYAKEHGTLQPLGAVNEFGQWLTAEDVDRLATLPPREQLTAQLVSTIAAPLSGFVTVLEGNLRGLVTVLDGIASSRQESA